MTKEDVLRIIRENLEITVESKMASGFTNRRYHTVKLLLAGDVIAEADLPETED